MTGVKMAIVAFSAVYLVGCADPIAIDFDGPAEPNSAFNEALRVGYSDLSVRNSSDADDTYHFAAKSKFSAAGRAVQPDHPDSRRLTGGAVAEVESGYQRMLRTLYLGASQLTPEPAARMQVAFDCWIADLEDIGAGDSCAATFHEALAKVEGVCDSTLAEACAPPVVAAAPPEPAPPPEPVPGPFIVYFDFDSAALTGEARGVIAEAADAILGFTPNSVGVTGHTDRAGGDAYNRALSEQREQAVVQALIESGVDGALMSADHLGEARPRVATDDGARNAENRRVEIELSN